MKYLHSMVRVHDLDASLRFYCEGLGLREVRRRDVPQGNTRWFSFPRRIVLTPKSS